jgi:hypothetical protein
MPAVPSEPDAEREDVEDDRESERRVSAIQPNAILARSDRLSAVILLTDRRDYAAATSPISVLAKMTWL